MALFAWVPWVPGNPSISEQWVAEPINNGKKQLKCTQISIENEQAIGAGNLEKHLGTHQFEFLREPLNHSHIKDEMQ